MYETKKRIYKNFDNTQKNGLCNNIRALVKQNLELPESEILEKFLEDEQYYLEIQASRFPFISEYINEDEFIKDTLEYIYACKKYYEYKEKQRPIIEANKAFEKKKRKFLQEVKMSKEPATKRQLYYYDKLCKRYGVEKVSVEGLSKLDLKNKIESMLDEYSRDYEDID